MSYAETRVLLAAESLAEIEQRICRLVRSPGSCARAVGDLLQTRDELVQEIQKWNHRIETERRRNSGDHCEHSRQGQPD